MLANRVREFTLTAGAGDITLAGALPGHIAFADGFTVGDSVTYVIEDGDDYEIGTGTLTAADTLQRTSVGEILVSGIYDKASPSPISLSGNARVYCAATADFLLDPTLEVDTIREQTPDGGVTVDTVLLKDGGGTFVNPVISQGADAPFDARVVQDTMTGTIPVHWQKQATSYILQAGGVGNLATFDLASLNLAIAGSLNINGGNSIHSADYGNLLIGDFAGGNNGITIQTPNTGRGGIAFSDGNTSGVASRQGRFDFTHALDRFEWLTSDGLRMSLSATALDVNGEILAQSADLSGSLSAQRMGIGLSLSNYYQNRVGGGFTSGGSDVVTAGLILSSQITAAPGDTAWHAQFATGSAVGSRITTQGAAETVNLVTSMFVGEPGITVGAGDTVQQASALYVQGPPSEAVENYALLVASGQSLFGGSVGIGDAPSTHKLEVKGSSASIAKLWRSIGAGWLEFNEGTTTKALFGYESAGGSGIASNAVGDAVVLRSYEGPIHLVGGQANADLGLTVASDLITLGRNTQINGKVGVGGAPHATYEQIIYSSSGNHIRLDNDGELGFIRVEDAGNLTLWAHGDTGDTVDIMTGSGAGTVVASFSGTLFEAQTNASFAGSVTTPDLNVTHTGPLEEAVTLGDLVTISNETGIYLRTTGNAVFKAAAGGTFIWRDTLADRMSLSNSSLDVLVPATFEGDVLVSQDDGSGALLDLFRNDVSVASGDIVGLISATGYDLSTKTEGARIEFEAAADWDGGTAGYSATNIKFYTQSNDSTDQIAAGPALSLEADMSALFVGQIVGSQASAAFGAVSSGVGSGPFTFMDVNGGINRIGAYDYAVTEWQDLHLNNSALIIGGTINNKSATFEGEINANAGSDAFAASGATGVAMLVAAPNQVAANGLEYGAVGWTPAGSGAGATPRAAIIPVQQSADSDVLGLKFYVHSSAVNSDPMDLILTLNANLSADFADAVYATQFRSNAGSAATPTHSFATDTDTGMYRSGTNALGFSTGGAQALGITTTDFNVYRSMSLQDNNLSGVGILTVTNEIRVPDGGPADPAYAFSNDIDRLGLYRHGPDTLGISAGGVGRMLISDTQMDVVVPLFVQSKLIADSGAKLSVQNQVDGGSGQGVFLWDTSNTGYGIYMASPGANKSLSDGIACTPFSGGLGISTRIRVSDVANQSLVFENSSEQCLMELTASEGHLFTRGNVGVGGKLNLGSPTELTISSGEITVGRSYHKIDTEADAATDDLVTINGGNAGDRIVLSSTSSARTITLRDMASGGNLQIAGDFSLGNPADTIELIFDGSNWLEIGRSNNG